MSTNPELFWGVIASMYIANIVLFFLNVPLVGLWVNMLRIPGHIFWPMILMMVAIGSYSARNSMLDVYLLLVFGILGYILRKFDFELAPIIIGFVLGDMIEKHLREGLFVSIGDPSTFFSSWVATTIWIVVLIVLTLDIQRKLFKRLLRPVLSKINRK
jgi:putative tricarboxylic transport membrane protein